MSNSLFFFITAVYILWIAISGAKAKQKREIKVAKPGQPGLTGITQIALADNASLPYDDIQPVYESHEAERPHSHDYNYYDASVSSEPSSIALI